MEEQVIKIPDKNNIPFECIPELLHKYHHNFTDV